MPLKINGSTSGSVTLAAPATGSDVTLTLPSGVGSSGQLLSTDGAGVLSFVNGGKILQVVSARSTSSTVVSSTTLADSGLSATITPTKNDSKVLVIVQQKTYLIRSASNSIAARLRLVRGSTTIETWGDSANVNVSPMGYEAAVSANGFQQYSANIFGMYVDSPATTSATTYKTQGAVSTTSDSASVTFQVGSSPSYMLLIEVAA